MNQDNEDLVDYNPNSNKDPSYLLLPDNLRDFYNFNALENYNNNTPKNGWIRDEQENDFEFKTNALRFYDYGINNINNDENDEFDMNWNMPDMMYWNDVNSCKSAPSSFSMKNPQSESIAPPTLFEKIRHESSTPELEYFNHPFCNRYYPDSNPSSSKSTPRSATSSITKSPTPSNATKKRTRSNLTHSVEKERRVRPKVIPEKGSQQCRGINQKKNTQCKNAALMEYIGPRPIYCAEHITLDSNSLYTKCDSIYHKIPADGKGCREVVLKEFRFCHKHFAQAIEPILQSPDVQFKLNSKLERINILLIQLETEAANSKYTEPDLFQRKHKLIPKFVNMKKSVIKALNYLSDQSNLQKFPDYDLLQSSDFKDTLQLQNKSF